MAFSGQSSGQSEWEPLLSTSTPGLVDTHDNATPTQSGDDPDFSSLNQGESFDNVPKERRQLGLSSAVFLVFNKIIGTGIYATPTTILVASNGVIGISFLMWLVGAAIAMAGTAVFVELGTGLPRSGGEKNYLEFIYRRPLYLVTCVYTAYTMIMGSAAANSIVFGEYLANALVPQSSTGPPLPTDKGATLPIPIVFAALALLCTPFVHGMLPVTYGLRLQNTLGIIKFFVLSFMSVVGAAIVLGVPGLGWDGARGGMEWSRLWEGWDATQEGAWKVGWNGFVSGLFNIIWSYIGYSNANYALSEIRNPIRTIKIAAPLAVISVTAVYLCVNMAYFGVVNKDEIVAGQVNGKGRIIAALFFRNLFGEGTERALSLFIALSTLGNILTGQFVQARVIQELGRSGVLPFAGFFASNKPFGLPLAGLCTQALISVALLLGVPKGDAYTAIISTSSYSLSLINMFVSFGLLVLTTAAYKRYIRERVSPSRSTSAGHPSDPLVSDTNNNSNTSVRWDPPFKAYKWAVVLFLLSNIFLVFVPFIPPSSESGRVYQKLPYWTHPVASWSVSLIGITYWCFWAQWIPRRKGYRLVRTEILDEDGVSRYVFKKISTQI